MPERPLLPHRRLTPDLWPRWVSYAVIAGLVAGMFAVAGWLG